MTVRYETFAGELISENRGGTETFYTSDTLGSVIKCRDDTGTKTYSAEYWAYGEVRTSTGSNPSPWFFVGTLGYHGVNFTGTYVRARYLRSSLARWMTVDPLWPWDEAYVYARVIPLLYVDPSGLQVKKFFEKPQWIWWTPPFNPSEDDHRCRGRSPRPTNEWDDHFFWMCAICMASNNILRDSSGGRSDKENHFIAGCLARLRCWWWCTDNVGSYKEASDTAFGGTVSRADALATDDGWDYAGGLIVGPPGRKIKDDKKFCEVGARLSIWRERLGRPNQRRKQA